MNTSPVVVLILILLASSDAGVLSRMRLSETLNLAPEFSHKRDKYVPQNVDIIEVIEPSKDVIQVAPAGVPSSNVNLQGNQGMAGVPSISIQSKPSINPGGMVSTGLSLPIAISPVGPGTGNKIIGITQKGNVASGLALPTQLGITKPNSAGLKPADIDRRGLALPVQISRKSGGGISKVTAGKPTMGKPIGQIKPTMSKPIGQIKPTMGKPIGQIKPTMGKPIGQIKPTMGKPIGQFKPSMDKPIGQIKPVGKPSVNSGPKFKKQPGRNINKNMRTNPMANDRLVNKLFGNGNAGTNTQRRPNNKPINRRKACDFNIPSFLLPDMSVSQREFEKMYLLPALRAHLTATQCRSRALTVYIDWLLYLRLRNFNV